MSISTGLVGLGGQRIATGSGQDSFEQNFKAALLAAEQPPGGNPAAAAAGKPHWENRSRRILRALADESRGSGRYVKLVGTTNLEGGMRLIYHGKTRHWFSRSAKIQNTSTALIELARSAFRSRDEAEQSTAFQQLQAYLLQRRALHRAPKPEALRPYLRELLREISPADGATEPASDLHRLGHATASEPELQALRQRLASPAARGNTNLPAGVSLSAKALIRHIRPELPPGTPEGTLEQRITHLLKGMAALQLSPATIDALLSAQLAQSGATAPTTLSLSKAPVFKADWIERGEQIVLRIEVYENFAVLPPGPNPLAYSFQHGAHTLGPVQSTLSGRTRWCLQAALRTRIALEVPLTHLRSGQPWPPAATDSEVRVMSAEADLRLGAPDKWPLPPEFGNTFPLSVTPVLAGSLHVSAEEAARRLGNRAYTSLIAQVRDAVPNGAMLGDIDCENLSVRASQRLNEANRSAASFIEDVARQAFQDAHHEVETERADLMIQLRASIVPGSDAFSARFLTEPQQAKRSVIGVESAHAKAQSSPHALGSDIARAQPESNPPVQAAQSNSDQPDIARFLDRIDEAQSRHNARLEENDPDLLSPSFLRRHFGALLSPPTVDLQRPTDTARPLMLVGDADGSLLRLALAAWGAGYWHPSDNEQTLMLAVLLSEGVAMCKASAQSIADFQGDPIVGLQLKDIATALEASIAAQIEDNNAIPAQQLVFMGDILADRLTNQGGAIERAIRALHRRGAVFLRGNHDAVIDIPPGAATNANYYQWGGFARERLTDNATWQLLDDCFVNAWTDETHSIVLTHNGFFYDPRTDAWHTAVGRIPARDESGQVKSVQAFVEAMNDEALKAATVSTDFRPKAFIQGKDQLRPRNTLGPLPWVGHGHDGDCGLNDGRGVLNLNARADGDFIAVGVRVI